MNHLMRPALIRLLLLFLCPLASLAAKETFYAVGAARVDITPDYPIWLNGYAARQNESEGVDQHIFAQALVIGSSKKSLALLLTVDSVGVPGAAFLMGATVGSWTARFTAGWKPSRRCPGSVRRTSA